MSTKTFAGLAIALSLASAGLTLSTAASAEDEFDVAVAGNAITVTTKGSWHINKDYPWKVVQGDSKLDKSKFDLSEKSAKVSGAPKGSPEGSLKRKKLESGNGSRPETSWWPSRPTRNGFR